MRSSGAGKTRDRRTPLARHVEGGGEFVVDTGHLPLLITTWFGTVTVELAETYCQWFDDFVERSRTGGRRFVIVDDASRAERPSPPVRGRLVQLACPREIVVDRVVVVSSAALRGAITAMSWSLGNPITTAKSIEDAVRDSLELLDKAGIARPRDFKLRPAQPSGSRA